jgi:hypothetical protein
VHPGETPSSHVVDGLLEILLRDGDAVAQALRQRFVFKIIPMLNPDGVAAGCYRADPTSATNLNRMYGRATLAEHPSVYAAMAVVRQLHERGELLVYVDAHAHAGKRGCFLYGNAGPERAHEGALYAHLVALHCRYLDVDRCVFYRGEPNHAGSGREAVHAATGLPHVYTLECNYNSGHVVNELPPKRANGSTEPRALSPEPPQAKASQRPKYCPEIWREVGKGLALAALDLVGANPAPRGMRPGSNAAEELQLNTAYLALYKRKHTVTVTEAADDSEGDAEDKLSEAESGTHRPHGGRLAAASGKPPGTALAHAKAALNVLKSNYFPARCAQQKLIDAHPCFEPEGSSSVSFEPEGSSSVSSSRANLTRPRPPPATSSTASPTYELNYALPNG